MSDQLRLTAQGGWRRQDKTSPTGDRHFYTPRLYALVDRLRGETYWFNVASAKWEPVFHHRCLIDSKDLAEKIATVLNQPAEIEVYSVVRHPRPDEMGADDE